MSFSLLRKPWLWEVKGIRSGAHKLTSDRSWHSDSKSNGHFPTLGGPLTPEKPGSNQADNVLNLLGDEQTDLVLERVWSVVPPTDAQSEQV